MPGGGGARGTQRVLGAEQGSVGAAKDEDREGSGLGSCGVGGRSKEQLLPSFNVEGNKPISVPWALALVWLSCPRSQQPWAGLGNPKAERSSTRMPTTPENWEVARETPPSLLLLVDKS